MGDESSATGQQPVTTRDPRRRTSRRQTSKRQTSKRQRAVAVGLVGVAVAAGVAVAGTAIWVHRKAAPATFTAQTVPTNDVALVLGAQIYPDGVPSPYLRARLDLAKTLYDTGKVRAILVSGDNRVEHYNEPDGMRQYLIDSGIPAKQVIADYAGFDTYDSCVRARRVFGVTSLTIVTQAYHLPRAVTTCELTGMPTYGVGDESVAKNRTWRYGQVRELAANFKMVYDVASHRTPILGKRETSVDEALGR